jgi:maleate isomerase
VTDAEPSGTPILLVGTGMHTRDAVTTLAQQFVGQEFYTSNACGVDWLRLTLDQPDPLAVLK